MYPFQTPTLLPLPPFINRSLAAKIRTCQRLYHRAKATCSLSLLSSYRNRISSSLICSEVSFFRSLSHFSPSKFRQLSSSSIPTLTSNGSPSRLGLKRLLYHSSNFQVILMLFHAVTQSTIMHMCSSKFDFFRSWVVHCHPAHPTEPALTIL